MNQRIGRIQACHSIHHVVERATKRRALIAWDYTAKRIARWHSILQTQVLMVHRRLLEKSVQTWRKATRAALDRRQKYFLMMIFNRWKYYTDECIELRHMRYRALIHWATVKCKKAFAALKLNAEQNKDAKMVTTFGSIYGSTAAMRFKRLPNSCSRNTLVQHVFHPSDPMTYASTTAVNGQFHGNTGRKDMFWSDDVKGTYHKPGSISPPSFSRRTIPSHNHYSLHGSHGGDDRGRRSSANATTGYFSNGMPLPIFPSSISHERHTDTISGILQSPSHYLGLARSENSLSRTQPRHYAVRSSEEVGVTIPLRKPALRSTCDFIIANVLDEMIAKVERRTFGGINTITTTNQ